jgi:phthiocerol/phenolphthiocerol synthesis type-I polyketide synthase E
MPDAAYTLQVGRHPFPVRRLVLCRDRNDALEALESFDPARVWTSFRQGEAETPVAAWLPGDLAPEARLDAELFHREPDYRRAVEEAADLFADRLGADLLPCFAEGAAPGEHARAVLFVFQAGLAALWRSWGLTPRRVAGEGVGRIAAAVISGDLDLAAAADRIASGRELDGAAPEAFFEDLADGTGLLLVLGPGSERTAVLARWLDGERILPSVGEDGLSHEVLIEGLGRAWLAGAAVDWAGFHRPEARRRTALPTYPWEHQRFWREPARRELTVSSEAASRDRKREPEDWLYVPAWRRAGAPKPAAPEGDGGSRSWLIFDDEIGLGAEIARLLEGRGDRVLRVLAGDEAAFTAGDTCRIRPGRLEDCEALLGELRDRQLLPDRVLHLWGVTGGRREARTPEGFLATRRRGLDTLLALGRALAGAGSHPPVDVTVVTDGVHEVLGTETLSPEKAAVLAAVKVLPQEDPAFECRAVDLVWPENLNGGVTKLAEAVLAEAGAVRRDPIVALRGRRRWVQAFERLAGPERLEGPPARLRQGGVYLLTGGDGPFAAVLGQALWDGVQARMGWLISPEAAEAIDPVVARRLEALRAAGAEIELLPADVRDAAAVAAAVERLEERFGGLHGVLHGARDHGGQFAATVAEIDEAVLEARMDERVAGLRALEAALGDRELDFVLLSSSLAGVLGGLGVTADAAADAVLDAWAAARAADGEPWLSVAWDAWHPAGEQGRRSTGSSPAILNDDDVAEALRRVLDSGACGPVALSVTDLAPRLDRWLRRKGLPEAVAAAGSEPGRGRPQLATAYVAPRNDLERMIAGVWQELFGIDEIGVYDDFYELGGHSLLGTQVATRIREQLDVELPLRDFLEYSTIADLAQALAERQVERADPEDLEQFLAELEAMSEEEAALDASS